MEVALVPPVTDAPRRVNVADVRQRSDNEAIIRFSEIEDVDTASLVVGCHCLVHRELINEELLESDSTVPSWEGWIAIDQVHGLLGAVDEVIDRPGQPLLVIKRDAANDLLVPVDEAIIIDVDEDHRQITTLLPNGLLEL